MTTIHRALLYMPQACRLPAFCEYAVLTGMWPFEVWRRRRTLVPTERRAADVF